jgi:hypothetical protein
VIPVCRQTFYGDDPTAETILSAIANASAKPGEVAAMLEAVATLPPPRPVEGVAAVCETCIEAK